MQITSENIDSISSANILNLAKDALRNKNFDVAKGCLSILINRNSLDFFSRFHFAILLRKQKNISEIDAINASKDALIKILHDFPDVVKTPKSFPLFFVKLAETLYETGQMNDARYIYGFINAHFHYPEYIFRYAELLALENEEDQRITLLLQNAVTIDPGKLKIKDELFKQIIECNKKFKPEWIKEIASHGFKFSNGWFYGHIPRWEQLIPKENPRKILEIGSYEGQSICYLIETLADGEALEIHCLDTWEGGIEHQEKGVDMSLVEYNFDYNIKLASSKKANLKVYKHKGFSDVLMPKMLVSGMKNYFDFIYIDGSHLAADVLSDAILGFRLLKIGGLLCFDDYIMDFLPEMNRSSFENPKLAIDAFTNIYFRKIEIIPEVNYQLWIRKLSD